MDHQNTKLMVAAALGAIGGLLLGLYLWGPEEKKGKLSKHLDTLSKIVEELEQVEHKEARDLKEKISRIIKSVEKGMEDGKS